MARKKDTSYVITNRKKLDAFLREGGKLDDISLLVGQVSGKAKYPVGHVGSKSREKNRIPSRKIDQGTLERIAAIRRSTRFLDAKNPTEAQLKNADKYAKKTYRAQIRANRKQMISNLKDIGFSARGLGRKGRVATAVAKVAGVIAADKATGQYHKRAITNLDSWFNRHKIRILNTMLAGSSPTEFIKHAGEVYKQAIRQAFSATGHTDTGRLYRNIQYQLYSASGKEKVKAREKEARKLASQKRRTAKLRKAAKQAREKASEQRIG